MTRFKFGAALLALVACSSDGNTTRPVVTPASEPTAEARPVTAAAPPQPDVAAPPHHEAEWNRMRGKWVHFELWTPDVARAKAFYGEVLGWTFVDRAAGAAIWHRNRRIGRIQAAPAAAPASLATAWVGHVSSEYVDLPSVVGKVLVPATHVPEVGRLTVLVDDWGAPFGLIEAENGDARDEAPGAGDVVWLEHWSRDKKTVAAAADFYSIVGRYDMTWKYPRWITWGRQTDRTQYTVSIRDKVARLGYAAAPSPKLAGRFVPYVMVGDVAAAMAAASRLGGRIVTKPSAQGIATVADTGGAVIGLVPAPPAPSDR